MSSSSAILASVAGALNPLSGLRRRTAPSEVGWIAHGHAIAQLRGSFAAIPEGGRVRLAKRTSNLFRDRAASTTPGLDVSGLGGVIAVDPQARTADVQGMCTYEHLVDVTLRHGLAPLVVPQLKTITLGGAVAGLGIESAAFRNGLPHESVIEMDILVGSGEIVTASPTEHADLFYGFPNSYGSLGYATRLRIELEPVKSFVALRHIRFDNLLDAQQELARIATEQVYAGERVDYLDGSVFSEDEIYLSLGRQTDEPGPTSDYTGKHIYYRSMQHGVDENPKRDRLTIHDYLWRWDTDWFWCSRAFGAQEPAVRRVWPKSLLRSSFYWQLIDFDKQFHVADRIEERKGNLPRERVVQDIEVPIERTAEFVDWFLRYTEISPVWLCPLRLRNPLPTGADLHRPWALYPLEPGRTYVNIGFWSSVARVAGQPDGAANRAIEHQVTELDGHKSLYSESFYPPDEFAKLYYDGDHYQRLRATYDPQSRFPDLYAKAVKRQ